MLKAKQRNTNRFMNLALRFGFTALRCKVNYCIWRIVAGYQNSSKIFSGYILNMYILMKSSCTYIIFGIVVNYFISLQSTRENN